MRGEQSGAGSQEPECSPLRASAERWLGTPFYPRARLCQVGVDCCQLAAAVLEEAGLGRHDLPGEYTVDFGDHAAKSPLLAWFRDRPEWEPVSDAGDIEPGDVVLFRVGRVANHCGVALGHREFVHCLRGHGVMVSRLDDPTYARRFVCAFRAPGGGP